MSNHFNILATGMEMKANKASKQELIRRYILLYPKESEPPPGRYEPNGEIIRDEDGGIERLSKFSPVPVSAFLFVSVSE